jgi:hypothetical protein
MAAWQDADLLMQTSSVGGSEVSELAEVTTRPYGTLSLSVVMIDTPAARRRIPSLKSSAAIIADTFP